VRRRESERAEKIDDGDEEANDEEEAEHRAEEREAGNVEAVVGFAVDEDHFRGAPNAIQDERRFAGPRRDLAEAIYEIFGVLEKIEAERREGEEGGEGEEDERRKTKDEGGRTEDRGRRTEDGGRRFERTEEEGDPEDGERDGEKARGELAVRGEPGEEAGKDEV
jgi:hypothetical protein